MNHQAGRRVITQVRRPPRELVEAFGRVGVASVHEAMRTMGMVGLMDWGLRPLMRGIRLVGPAVTAHMSPGDNLALHVAVHFAEPGDVVVGSFDEFLPYGVLGELLGTSAASRGLGGVVVDAGVRDVSALRAMGFPVWCRAISALGTTKKTLVSVNDTLRCAGAIVEPGDLIVADDDGVAVVPAGSMEAVLVAAIERDEKEVAVRARYASGVSSYEHHRLDIVLDDAGVSVL
jgi:4-hydroxy-4-methyl-2-oxoglutarate aldolase